LERAFDTVNLGGGKISTTRLLGKRTKSRKIRVLVAKPGLA
jgi:hypothetical protein